MFSTLLTEAEHSLLTEENQRIVTSLKSLWETYLEAKENRERAASRLQQLQAENQRLAERERELLEHNRIKELDDIWGDSVNVAARMEQTSVPGKINISESTKQKLKGEYTFEERGEIEAKNKGKIKMYFVSKA